MLAYSKTDIKNLVKRHKDDIKIIEAQKKIHQNYIGILEKLKFGKNDRPPLPVDRNEDHFKIGERIMVYFWKESKWFSGEVKNGYRSNDGCVSFRLDGLGPQKKDFWGCGTAIPTVMLEVEYKWFKKHLEEYENWSILARNCTESKDSPEL